MRFAPRILLTFAAAVVAAALVSPLVKPAVDAAVCRAPWARQAFGYQPREGRSFRGRVEKGAYDFARVFRPLLLAMLLVGLAVQWRGLRVGELLRGGLARREGRWRRLGAGLGIGLVSGGGLVLILWALGMRRLRPWSGLGERGGVGMSLLRAMLEAAVPGVVEECIYRGILLGGLLAEAPAVGAVVLADAVFVLFHFFDGPMMVGFGFDASVGVVTAAECLRFSFLQSAAWTRALGLAGVGGVLCLAFAGSRSLYLPIGVHTGWVFATKAANLFLATTVARGDQWLYGSRWLVDGLFVWLAALPVGACVWRLARGKGRREAGQLHGR